MIPTTDSKTVVSKSLRVLGIMLALAMVASVAFSGGALADHNDDQDADAEVEQEAEQNAEINQNQQSDQTNAAVVNTGDQVNYNEQNQEASIDQDIRQFQQAAAVAVNVD